MKTSQKKATGQHSALEVRLNRAMEETDKYKSALQKARSDLKVRLVASPFRRWYMLCAYAGLWSCLAVCCATLGVK